MNEKIILFGAGANKNKIFNIILKYGGFEVVEIWDNNSQLQGTFCEFQGKNISIKKPYYQDKYNVLITTNIYYEEIRRQLEKEFSIPLEKIKEYNYIYKNFKSDIIEKYKDSKDCRINKICEFLKDNELDVFCGQIDNKYDEELFEIYKDEDAGLLYSYWKGKKIYLSSKFKDVKKAKSYLCGLCREQDDASPHCYNIDKLDLESVDLVIDGGSAEGFFALQVIDNVKKVYLVEGDESWLEALKYTFEPYKDKVTIIPKWLDSSDDETCITLDTLALQDEELKTLLIKLDVEGKESDVIKGIDKLLNRNMNLTCIVCTYHRSEDAQDISDYFKYNKFRTSFTEGYMFFPYSGEIKPELRKGVLTAVRNLR